MTVAMWLASGLAMVLAFGFALGLHAHAKVFVTLPEALARAFPAAKGCQTRPENRYLTPEQLKTAEALAGTPPPSALVVRYVAICGGKRAGHAYTDTHRVRTHPQTVLVVVDAAGKVARVETLSFDEPLEYLPRAEWYATFAGAALDAELEVRRKIPFVTGASLTSRATVQASRRALALEQVLAEKASPK